MATSGMARNDDGTVTLVLHGGREVKLRPLSVTENAELRDLRGDIEDWMFTTDAERSKRFNPVPEVGSDEWQEMRRSNRETVAEVAARNLAWLRRLVELVGGGEALPEDHELPAWLASTADLYELQSLLSSRPEAPQGRP